MVCDSTLTAGSSSRYGGFLIAIIAVGCGRIAFDAGGGPGQCSTSCVTDISFGRHFACLIKSDHTLWCSGENAVGELGIGAVSPPVTQLSAVVEPNGLAITDAIAIGAGREHACAVRADTTVWCW